MTQSTDSRSDGSDPATVAGETTALGVLDRIGLRDVLSWHFFQVRSLVAAFHRRTPRKMGSLAFGAGLALVFVATPVAAQTKLGGIYCGTPVETGINVLFTLLAGLGLPVTMFFTGKSGLEYMYAGGNPKLKNEAKQSLIMSAVGFSLIVGAILLPGFITKIGSRFGFSFSSCVSPY